MPVQSTSEHLLKEGQQNNRWINQHMDELRERYGGEFIAVDSGEVIAHSDDQREVVEEMEEVSDNPDSVIVTYIHKAGKKILR